jgi:hypothetical protein
VTSSMPLAPAERAVVAPLMRLATIAYTTRRADRAEKVRLHTGRFAKAGVVDNLPGCRSPSLLDAMEL